jgi:putative peptidoglycan lipid II flippase
MFAWGAQNIFARGFYATRDTITPAVVGTATTVLSLPLYWLLVKRLDYLGLALASTAGIIVYTIVLFVLLNRRTRNPETLTVFTFFLKVSAASIVVGAACYKLSAYLQNFIPQQNLLGAVALLTVVSTAGLLLLIALLKILRVPELNLYLNRALKFATRS